MTGCLSGLEQTLWVCSSPDRHLNQAAHAFIHIKISIQAPVSCILRPSTKSPNSITAFFGSSFLTVSEFSSIFKFPAEIGGTVVSGDVWNPGSTLYGLFKWFLMYVRWPTNSPSVFGIRPACALESASKNQYQVI